MIPKVIHYCWLASDDVRYINTGLGFGAVKNHYIIAKLMNAYSNYEYPSGKNVSRNTKVLENLLPNWRKSDTNQIFDRILIIGLKDYENGRSICICTHGLIVKPIKRELKK